MKPFTLFVLLALLCRAAYGDAVDNLIAEVNAAVEEDRYTLAVSLLEDGKAAWPLDTRILLRAGDLYLEQKLYRLALSEYLDAGELKPGNPDILHDISKAYSFLGNNDAAVEFLEEALNRVEDNTLRITIIDDLSWMYFKTHRMNEGITLLENVLKGEFNRGWAHTLGTLYSGVYDADQSREWYLRSIEDALDSGDEVFASVAYYNLSLLELTFYRYRDARDYARRSLELRNRAGGHIVNGELDLIAWNLTAALEAYREAESLDSTPLARVDIANFYRRVGRLDEAIRFANDISAEDDSSWMYFYGVDTVRFGMGLDEILAAAWKGKAKTLASTPQWGRGDRLRRFFRSLLWNARGIYHDMRYRALSAQHAAELTAEGNVLDSEWYAFRVNQGYRSPALRHLEKARALETSLTDYAVPWYLLEAGIEGNSIKSIYQAIETFQPEERRPVERALRTLAEDSSSALADLYAINPGGLRQYGLTLPIRLVVSGDNSPRLRRRIAKVLRSAGYSIVKNQGDSTSTLTASIRDGGISWYMASPEGRTISEARTGSIKKIRSLAKVLAGLLDRFYYMALE